MGKLTFNGFAILLLAAFISASDAEGAQLQKTFTWKYPASKETRIILNNYDCDMVIHVWNKNETEFNLTINATGVNTDDETRLINYMNGYKFSNSGSTVTFHNSFWKVRRTINKKTILEIEGEDDIDLTEFNMKGELWIPAVNPLEINSKYSKINLEDFSGKLILDLYNSDLYAGNLAENTKITAKYANLEIKDMKDLNADLYNCDFEAGSTGKISLVSKYSKFNTVNSGSLDINSYNDKFSFEKTGDIIFRAKYSDLKTLISGTADLDCYNGVLILEETKNIKVNSKYTDFQFNSTGDCNITSSYNDKFKIGKISSLKIDASKYSNYKAEILSGSLTESDGYNDKYTISSVDAGFKGIYFNGKYLDISLGIPSATDFRLKAAIKYPSLDIDYSPFKTRIKIVENSNFQYDGIKGIEKEGMPVVEVNGYNASLKMIWLK